jgi:hypothetical protein
MRRLYVVIASLVVAVAAVLGVYSVTHSAGLGLPSAQPQSASTTVAQANQRLDATQAALSRALAQQPPTVTGGGVPFVPPHQIVVNVSGSPAATPYAPAPTHFYDDGGEHGD